MSSAQSSAVSKKSQAQEVSKSTTDDGYEVEHKEANASANAGVNLNIVGAVSGLFSGSQTKETKEDGSSVTHTQGAGRVDGSGEGNLAAQGGAAANSSETKMKGVSSGESKRAIQSGESQKGSASQAKIEQ